MTPSNLMVFSWIFNAFDFGIEISWALNWEFLRGFLEDFHGIFNAFFMGFSA